MLEGDVIERLAGRDDHFQVDGEGREGIGAAGRRGC